MKAASLSIALILPVIGACQSTPPVVSVTSEMQAYREISIAYFRPLNLLPILVPGNESPGDVYRLDTWTLTARSNECFHDLNTKGSEFDTNLPSMSLTSDGQVGFVLGSTTPVGLELKGARVTSVSVSYADAHMEHVSSMELANDLSPTCHFLDPVVRESLSDARTYADLPIVVGAIVTAKPQLTVSYGLDRSGGLSSDGLVAAVSAALQRQLPTYSKLGISVSASSKAQDSIVVKATSPVPVAFAPAFVPKLVFENFKGSETTAKPSTPIAATWHAFNRHDHTSVVLLQALTAPLTAGK